MAGGGGGVGGAGGTCTIRPQGQGACVSGAGGLGVQVNMTNGVTYACGGGGGGTNRDFGPIAQPGAGNPYGGGNGGDPSNYYANNGWGEDAVSPGSGGGGAGQAGNGAGRGQPGIIYVRYPVSSL